MCQFQSLYYSDHGYVVRCCECECYQVAFGTTMITLNEEDFGMMMAILEFKCNESIGIPVCLRNIVIPTPAQGVNLLLTSDETRQLSNMLEQADNECRYRALRQLFNAG